MSNAVVSIKNQNHDKCKCFKQGHLFQRNDSFQYIDYKQKIIIATMFVTPLGQVSKNFTNENESLTLLKIEIL